MKYTKDQLLEEEHQDTLDIQADAWENELKWFQSQDEAIIEVYTEIPLKQKHVKTTVN